MANTKVTGGVIADGAITAAKIASGALDGILNTYLTTNTYATESYVTTAVNNLIDAAPASLDTLNELAAALNDDANFATTVTNSLATKLNLSGGTISGNLTVTGSLLGTLSTAAQPNITSVGTLSSLTTSGDVIVGNDIYVSNGNFLKLQRTSGGLYIDVLGNESGTDNVRLLSSGDFKFVNGSVTELMRITNAGNVGIGTASPTDKLHVIGKALFNNSSFGTAQIRLLGFGSSTGFDLQNSTNDGYLWNRDSGNIYFGTANTERMRIDNVGNVGIGSSSPVSKLTLEGAKNTNTLTLRSTNNDSSWVSGDKFGSIDFYSNDGSGAGAGVKGSISYINDIGTSGAATAMTFSTASLATNNIERMRIDSSGNVGIGTSNPGSRLSVIGSGTGFGLTLAHDSSFPFGTLNGKRTTLLSSNSGDYNGLQLGYDDVDGTGVIAGATNTLGAGLDFYTYNGYSWGNRMRITKAGNVGIGTNSPAGNTNANSRVLQVNSDGTNPAEVKVSGPNSELSISSGSNASYLWSKGAYPLVIGTNEAEKMRITSGGNILINTTTSTAAERILEINGNIYSKGTAAGFFWNDRSNASNYYGWYATGATIYLWNGSSNIASINTSNGTYTALSDKNKKKDLEDSTIGLDAVLGLKPKLYRMETDSENDDKQLGFIAQEVRDFIPQAYVESDEFIGLNDRPILAAAIKAIQELKAEIEILKSQINA